MGFRGSVWLQAMGVVCFSKPGLTAWWLLIQAFVRIVIVIAVFFLFIVIIIISPSPLSSPSLP